jgi:2-keto-myo-inositol isomerase
MHNAEQIAALVKGGYGGYISFEPFAEEVTALQDPEPALRASMWYLREQCRL